MVTDWVAQNSLQRNVAARSVAGRQLPAAVSPRLWMLKLPKPLPLDSSWPLTRTGPFLPVPRTPLMVNLSPKLSKGLRLSQHCIAVWSSSYWILLPSLSTFVNVRCQLSEVSLSLHTILCSLPSLSFICIIPHKSFTYLVPTWHSFLGRPKLTQQVIPMKKIVFS